MRSRRGYTTGGLWTKLGVAFTQVSNTLTRRSPNALIVGFLEPRLARFAIPRYVEVLAALPRNASGKVEKFRLRERGLTAAACDLEAVRKR